MSCGAQLERALPVLRHARARGGQVLHGLRHGARRPARRARGAAAGRRASAAARQPRHAGRRAPPGDGALRRPLRLHGRVRADGPGGVKALVDRCLRRLGEEVTRYGGTVDKYIGDNVMAIFGAPVAHEDDEERAVRAALGMQGAMDEINAELTRAPRHELPAARRHQHRRGAGRRGRRRLHRHRRHRERRRAAPGRRRGPGTVTVGERTYRATADEVEYRELDPLHLKGKAEPVPAWEAVGLVAAQPTPARPRARGHAARRPRRRARR